MRDRYVLPPDDLEIVDRIIAASLNLVGWIYAKIYFPTYSNSLKEVGRYLGHEWTWPEASGAAAPLLRRAWELGAGDHLKARSHWLQHGRLPGGCESHGRTDAY